MFRGIINLGIIAIVFTAVSSCKTTQPVRVDKARGEMDLFSVDDKSTALPDPKNSSSLTSMVVDLEEMDKSKTHTKKSLLNLAQLYLIRGELDKSESTIRRVLRKDLKNKEARLILANVFVRRGMYDMAAIILSNLGGVKSKDSRIINLMAMTALHKGENSRALALFRNAIKVNSSDISVRMNLGVLFLKYRQLNEAAIQFERVLSFVPKHQDAKLHLATILLNRGNKEKAEEIYKEILSDDEDNQVALYNYAVLQGETKEYEDAIDNLKKFIESEKGQSYKTDRAFALINKIRTKMISEGGKISNEDIDALALELEKKENENKRVALIKKQPKKIKKKKIEKKIVKVKKKQPIKKMAAKKLMKRKKPKKVVKPAPKKEAPEENIEDLEKMLLE